ncbi:DUF4177 domain-containing protein [Pseudooceanicola spongiae]|uniref:DUF4177 domain-containing protein n=1 Tax=Pseudooceanicola spongiae TaxID=2613965 RepID=A0A7L9WLT5_9RHOB|nr:DUF4177 domain-containing protein [Pseudooceanicola spongiae]QOL80677.1 DUF4177 domain-containing protein [Pseudooceanicola spongiae]
MTQYDYKVMPAPTRGTKARGIKTAEGRFANAFEELLNEMAAKGWEYQRAETLPQEERQGLTGTSSSFRNLLVFRRAAAHATVQYRPEEADTAEAFAEDEPEKRTPASPSVGSAQRSEALQGQGPRLSGVVKSPAAQVIGRASAVAEGEAKPAPGVSDASASEWEDKDDTRKPD